VRKWRSSSPFANAELASLGVVERTRVEVEYGNCLAAIAVCQRGHQAQLPHEWVKLAASYGVELQQARARLWCSKCGGRMPRVEVYRVGG
jgi:hypothetical protein